MLKSSFALEAFESCPIGSLDKFFLLSILDIWACFWKPIKKLKQKIIVIMDEKFRIILYNT